MKGKLMTREGIRIMRRLVVVLLVGLLVIVVIVVAGCGKTKEITLPETTAPETFPSNLNPPPHRYEFSEEQRKQIYQDLEEAQNSGISDAEAYSTISAKHNVSMDALSDIVKEGVANNWPVPSQP